MEATEFTAPEAPDRAQELLPETSNGFAEDLWHVIKTAISALQPDLMEASATCLSIIAVIMLVSIIQNYSEHAKKVAIIVGAIGVSVLLLQSTHSLVRMASSTVIELSEYGKLLLPVMTAALAAQGGASTSVALYTGTAFFDAVLTTIIAKLIVPMIYIYICLCIANCALQEQTIRSLRGFAKWLATWSMKTVLYIFTGYMGITGVVSGTTDAAVICINQIVSLATAKGTAGIILAHNHPHGLAIPSSEDIEATAKIAKALRGIGSLLVDHLIFADNDYVSMSDSGYLNTLKD